MMTSREGKVPPPPPPAPPDLLVCFPTRAHLRLMPRPTICTSPARPSSDSAPPHRHRRKSNSTSRFGGGSPLLWVKSKAAHNSDASEEPSSPKVTCAGQIKVRAKAKPTACKNWQSVMEEIERIHQDRRKHKMRRSAAAYSWIESLGFKKDVTHFLSCLRNLRFDFRCFGAFPSAGITSDDDDEDDDDETERENCQSKEDSNAVFSKWYMILQENQGAGEFANPKEESMGKTMTKPCFVEDGDESPQNAPPSNALLLMRCRSAPAKNWPPREVEEKLQETVGTECKEADGSKISEEIAKETWIVGGIREMLERSRSWKR